jgi:hypothetical protein
VSVLIDLDTLRDGAQDGAVSETSDGEPVDVDTIRRMGCDGDLVGIVLDDLGIPLAVGRAQRLATREQRQALRAMYRTCAFPGCTVPFDWCRIHHVNWWTRHHGATNLDNLVPICATDHHRVHEGGWTLQLHPDRTITVHHPDGTVWFEGDTTNRGRPKPPEPATPQPAELSDLDNLRAGLAEALDLVIVRQRE